MEKILDNIYDEYTGHSAVQKIQKAWKDANKYIHLDTSRINEGMMNIQRLKIGAMGGTISHRIMPRSN